MCLALYYVEPGLVFWAYAQYEFLGQHEAITMLSGTPISEADIQRLWIMRNSTIGLARWDVLAALFGLALYLHVNISSIQILKFIVHCAMSYDNPSIGDRVNITQDIISWHLAKSRRLKTVFSNCSVIAQACREHLPYGDVIMGAIASQITSLTIVYSTV